MWTCCNPHTIVSIRDADFLLFEPWGNFFPIARYDAVSIRDADFLLFEPHAFRKASGIS